MHDLLVYSTVAKAIPFVQFHKQVSSLCAFVGASAYVDVHELVCVFEAVVPGQPCDLVSVTFDILQCLQCLLCGTGAALC